MRVHIVGINFSPEPTGIAPYTTRIASGLIERGHDVRVTTTFPHYPQWRIGPEWAGWTRRQVVEGVPLKRVRHYVPADPVGIPRALSEVSFGARAVASSWSRPDVVLSISPALLSSSMVVARARAAGVPVGVLVQDIYSVGLQETSRGRAARAMGRIERRTLRAADGVGVIHDRFRARLVSSLGVDPERIVELRNWTHVRQPVGAERSTVRARMGWGEETVVLHSGAMGQKQDLGAVVEAARLAERRGLAVRFVLMGDGGERARLEAQAAGLSAVTFLDPVDERHFADVLSAADVLLVHERPGVVEMAVPSKLTSYFSVGVPVLAATDEHSTTAEEVARADAGLVIAPGDPEELLEGVRKIVVDERRPLWSQNGPLYCREMLSESAALDRYEAWLARLAG